MFRFTIRDVLWLTVVAALAAGWWTNLHRSRATTVELRKQLAEQKLANAELGAELDVARSYPQSEQRLRELRYSAKTSPLARDKAREVLTEVMYAENSYIRARAMAILPYLRERREAIAALRLAIRERDERGVIPNAAASCLANMSAIEATSDVRGWLEYLEHERPYDSRLANRSSATPERTSPSSRQQVDDERSRTGLTATGSPHRSPQRKRGFCAQPHARFHASETPAATGRGVVPVFCTQNTVA